MIHLDTHVVIWLAGGKSNLVSDAARRLIESVPVQVSPIVELELAFLAEIKRVTDSPREVLGELQRALNLTVGNETLHLATSLAATSRYSFTRDPFDRVIGAHADAVGAKLITKDRVLRENLDFAIWD